MKHVCWAMALTLVLSSGLVAPVIASHKIPTNCPGIESAPIVFHEAVSMGKSQLSGEQNIFRTGTVFVAERGDDAGMSLAAYLKRYYSDRRILCILYVPLEKVLGARFEIFSTNK